ncbi:MAG: hypothetical protein IJT79_00580 [Ruminococcus sp.]|nr:hypothetical protein [Ruminococcus sp.]
MNDKCFDNAIKWIHNNTACNNGGIVVTDKQRQLYPEVTGYYIPSLLNYGEKELAISFAKYLCETQKEDGSWYDSLGNNPFIFDTGQILKGLVAIRNILPEVDEHIIKGINWMFSNMNSDGRLVQPNDEMWGKDKSICNELIHIYTLSPILEAAKVFNKPEWEAKVNKILDYYIDNYRDMIVNYSMFSHFYAYVIEGLIDCGRESLAREAMTDFCKYVSGNGAVCAYNDVKWVCSTACFQFAIIWYKLKEKEKADLTYQFACSLQNPSGGWYGSYADSKFKVFTNRIKAKLKLTRGMYLVNEEISWAVKFYLDAKYLKDNYSV